MLKNRMRSSLRDSMSTDHLQALVKIFWILQVLSVMNKASEGVEGLKQGSSEVVHLLVQMQADKQASENAQTKQRVEAQRMDTAKAIMSNKDAYPEEIVEKAKKYLMNLFA
jgi:hypothetical protein